MKVIIGAAASNIHLNQIGRAMEDAGALSKYVMPFGGWPLRCPIVFSRRSPSEIPKIRLRHYPAWEVARVAASRLRMPDPWIDLIWERGEHAFDRHCARLVASERPNVFMGVEHAALASLKSAKTHGVAAGLIFPSLHHAFRRRWLDPELDRFPQLVDRAAGVIRKRDSARDERRDSEMQAADFIHANSSTTARSLVDAGFSQDRIITVPLGSPPALSDSQLPETPPFETRVVFAGNVALHKGAHHLIEAWRNIGPRKGARLDLYGSWALPNSFRPSGADRFVAHGRVSRDVVRSAMRFGSVLVLPSVCDGFGMVVSEAMAQGLPVICSSNAGASQLIVEGENGFVVPPADPQRLAALLLWCIEHPAELHAMGRRAADTARNWTWDDFRVEFTRKLSRMLRHIGMPSDAPFASDS